jgi:hypothetical protein
MSRPQRFNPPDRLTFFMTVSTATGFSTYDNTPEKQWSEWVASISLKADEVWQCLREIEFHRADLLGIAPGTQEKGSRATPTFREYEDSRVTLGRLKEMSYAEFRRLAYSRGMFAPEPEPTDPTLRVLAHIAYDGKTRALLPEQTPSIEPVRARAVYRRPLPNTSSLLWSIHLPGEGEVTMHRLAREELARALALLAPPEREAEAFRFLAEIDPNAALDWHEGEIRWPGTEHARPAPQGLSRADFLPLLRSRHAEQRLRAIALAGTLPDRPRDPVAVPDADALHLSSPGGPRGRPASHMPQ